MIDLQFNLQYVMASKTTPKRVTDDSTMITANIQNKMAPNSNTELVKYGCLRACVKRFEKGHSEWFVARRNQKGAGRIKEAGKPVATRYTMAENELLYKVLFILN